MRYRTVETDILPNEKPLVPQTEGIYESTLMQRGNSHSLEKSLMESKDTESSIEGLWASDSVYTGPHIPYFLWKPLALHHRMLKIVNLSLSHYGFKYIF